MIDDKNILEIKSFANSLLTTDELFRINDDLCLQIFDKKNSINEYSSNKSWDICRKITNKYENVNMVNRNKKFMPVSRSFYKLWEILFDFEGKLFDNDRSLKCLFLAEGPGGFIEAFIKYRQFKNEDNFDQYHAITLRDEKNFSIPCWREKKSFMRKVILSYGEDGTGNLYNNNNIAHLFQEFGRHSMDFITGDGGFDFSSDYNNQEGSSFNLITAEVASILLLQKVNGSCVLKIYDVFQENTIKLIHVLKNFYEHIYFIKPFTSRPANSERYIVCSQFKNNKMEEVNEFWFYYKTGKMQEYLNEINLNVSIFNSIVKYNIYHTFRQSIYIEKTLNIIKNDLKNLDKLTEENHETSKQWHEFYFDRNLYIEK